MMKSTTTKRPINDSHRRRKLRGTVARAVPPPLDFKLFNFSGDFRATQMLTFDS